MSIAVEAIYEDGVLKPVEPLNLAEHERVILQIQPALSRMERLAQKARWTGDPKVLRQIAEDPDLLESP